MQSNTKADILSNTFVAQLRTDLRVDEPEYAKLVASLTQLCVELKGEPTIDRELMAVLYRIPQVVRTVYERLFSFDSKSEIGERLVEMWCELDDLMTQCLNE